MDYVLGPAEEDFSGENYDDYATNKCATIYLVDATKEMFRSYDSERGSIVNSPFGAVMKCVKMAFRQTIMSNDSDLLSIVFFGTEKTQNHLHHESGSDSSLKHIYTFQQLEPPSSDRIISLIDLEEGENLLELERELGHSENYSLGEAFWVCSDMLKNKSKQLVKRIMVFTCNDDPHGQNDQLKRNALKRADLLIQSGIELIPVAICPPSSLSFSGMKFYANIERSAYGSFKSSDCDDKKFMVDATERFNNLRDLVLTKDHKKRPLASLHFNLGSDKSTLAVKVFNLVRRLNKPPAHTVTRQTGEVVKRTTTLYTEEFGEDNEGEPEAQLVMPQDVVKFQEFGGKRAVVEQHELQELKNFGPSGIELIGFKPLSSLNLHRRYNHNGHFIYPDESAIQGSTKIFSALLDRCLAREVYVLCRFISKKRSPPRLVALVPSAENNPQKAPSGFHLAYLPFADDIRDIAALKPEHPVPVASSGQVQAAKAVVEGLTENYRSRHSPLLQTHWTVVEAVALGLTLNDEVPDDTLPDNKLFTNAKSAIDAFTGCIPADPERPAGTKRAATKAALENSGDLYADVHQAYNSDQINSLTVAVLKAFVQSHLGVTSGLSSMKKQNLVDKICEHFAASQQPSKIRRK